MEPINELLETLKKENLTKYEDFPDIELYMDQVVTYLARESLPFKTQDKLTSAMINNYIKDGLLPRTSGKKYSREHLVYLILISKLKQVLSVKEIGAVLSEDMNGTQIDEYYDAFLSHSKDISLRLTEDIQNNSSYPVASIAMNLALVSYFYKAASEFLISKIREEKDMGKKEKKK